MSKVEKSHFKQVQEREQKKFMKLRIELGLPISERVRKALQYWGEGTRQVETLNDQLELRKKEEDKLL